MSGGSGRCLMAVAGPAGVGRRRAARTTIRDDRPRPAADLADRDVYADGPDMPWGCPSWRNWSEPDGRSHHPRSNLGGLSAPCRRAGCLLAGWPSCLNPMAHRWLPVGRFVGTDLKTLLAPDAIDMAADRRKPSGVIHHGGQGSRCTSLVFGLRGKEAGIGPSTELVGDACDNAPRLPAARQGRAKHDPERGDACAGASRHHRMRTARPAHVPDEGKAPVAVFEFIEGWSVPGRRHPAPTHPRPSTTTGPPLRPQHSPAYDRPPNGGNYTS